MRQHPIPQNVLDVEFKLFTKFTVKEFVYMAVGITVGGIFIYLWTNNILPGIIAFPLFMFFTAVGLLLGLIPINDQPAEKFIISYIQAITKPTLRVWQGEEMKMILKQRQQEKVKKGKSEKKQVTPPVNLIDIEEEEKLKHIDKLMEETGLKKAQPVQKNAPQERHILITDETIQQYTIPSIRVNLNGTINLLLVNKNNQPISNATVIIKDAFDKPKIAIRSGMRGEALTDKIIEKGEYHIEILHDNYTFKNVHFVVQRNVYPIVKIMST
jgi:hypothetical protein